MEIEAAAEGGRYATIWSGTGLKTYRIVTANWQPTNVKRSRLPFTGQSQRAASKRSSFQATRLQSSLRLLYGNRSSQRKRLMDSAWRHPHDVSLDVRAILSHPVVYRFFRKLTGSIGSTAALFGTTCARGRPDILDVGCGGGDVLNLLGDVHYYGIDSNVRCISAAAKQFGSRGVFRVMDVTSLSPESFPACDTIVAMGVLHHLTDDDTLALLLAKRLLKPRGRFISYDPCFVNRQNPFARAIHSLDRGQHVRNVEPASKSFKPPSPRAGTR